MQSITPLAFDLPRFPSQPKRFSRPCRGKGGKMGNTHILSKAFEYVEPKTVEEVLRFLDQHGDKAKIIAGGTDLLVEMKKDGLHPDYLINIARVPSLRFLISDRGLRIGPPH